jgi:hypothetical protein
VIAGLLLSLIVAGAMGCPRRSADGTGSMSPGSGDEGAPLAKNGQPESTNGYAETHDSVQAPLSSSTTAASSNYEISLALLRGLGPYGSGDEMLALASGARTIRLRSDDGSGDLTLTIEVEYNNYRPDRSEMWILVPSQRGSSMPTYGVVPVHLGLTSADGRIGFSIDRAELVSAERARAAIEHVYGGSLSGSWDYEDFGNLDPGCSQVRLLLDFRTDDVHARLQVENPLNAVCRRWQTSEPPLPWGAVLGSN